MKTTRNTIQNQTGNPFHMLVNVRPWGDAQKNPARQFPCVPFWEQQFRPVGSP